MKKIIAVLLALVLAVSASACGTGAIKPADKEPAEETAQEEAESPSDEAEATDPAEEPAEETPAESDSDFDESIQESLLVDEAGIRITALSLDKDGILGPEMKVLIENNSGKNLTFQTRKVSVNNYMVDSMLSAEVADGKKSNEDITFISTDLEASGIEHIADIELSFYVFDSESWETYFESDLVTIRTADGEKYDYTYDDSGDLAFENDIAKIVIKGTAEDASTFGPSIWVYIENKGESSITVQAGNTSVNGIMIDPFFACEVGVGKHAVDKLTFMSSDLEENGISEIDTVELTFKIYNSADWLNITESEPVTVKF